MITPAGHHGPPCSVQTAGKRCYKRSAFLRSAWRSGPPVSGSRWLFAGLVCGALLSGCGTQSDEGFIRLQDGRFVRHGEPFFPMVMNIQVNLIDDGTTCWPASYSGYNTGDRFRYTQRDSALLQLRSEWMLLRQLGFNTVRVVSLTEGPVVVDSLPGPQIKARGPRGAELLLPMNDRDAQRRYLAAVDDLLDVGRSVGMYVILLTTIHQDRPGSRDHFALVADHLRADTAVLAFDVFNEPLYFDLPARKKREVRAIVREWRKLARKNAPQHLITIGLTGIREVHAWDPHLLDVDFISFHPYAYEPDQVLNEISWYGRHVRRPWIIGETSLPADNDSVSYADQERFAQRTLDQVRACGGIGYSWWQFKDVRWGRFHSDYMGLLEMEGTIAVAGAPLPVTGSVKPAARVFATFDPHVPAPAEEKLPNYLNYSQHRAARLTGRLVDTEGLPIEGGVVLAWNRGYSHSYHTTTQADGTFELLGDMYFHHWIASALDHEMQRGDCPASGFVRDTAGTASFFLGELQLARIQPSR
jgi:hypothetical protein